MVAASNFLLPLKIQIEQVRGCFKLLLSKICIYFLLSFWRDTVPSSFFQQGDITMQKYIRSTILANQNFLTQMQLSSHAFSSEEGPSQMLLSSLFPDLRTARMLHLCRKVRTELSKSLHSCTLDFWQGERKSFCLPLNLIDLPSNLIVRWLVCLA